jgi:hypothetical protein
MIRPTKALSSPNFYPACESEESGLKRLKNLKKMTFHILGICLRANLRSRSKRGEQNALCRGFLGPPTESAAIRLTRAGAPAKTRDAMGTFGLSKVRRQIVIVGRNISGQE